MSYGDLSDKLVELLLVEYLADKPHVLVVAEFAPVAHGNAAAFLSSVLQRDQTVIDAGSDGDFPVIGIYAENPAFLVQLGALELGIVNYAFAAFTAFDAATLTVHRFIV